MPISHDLLAELVPKVNGAIAVVSCPFALYEALSKRAGVTELKGKLDLCIDQLIGKFVSGIEDALLPFWPASVTTIIIQPALSVQTPPSLSDSARDALTEFVGDNCSLSDRLSDVRRLIKKIHRLDRTLYWLIFATAISSLGDLVIWLVYGTSVDWLLKTEIFLPGSIVVCCLFVAGIRQAYIQAAERHIIEV